MTKQEFKNFLSNLKDYNKLLDEFSNMSIEMEFVYNNTPAMTINEESYIGTYRVSNKNIAVNYEKRAKKLNYKKTVFGNLTFTFSKEITNIDDLYEIYTNSQKYIYRHQIYESINAGIKELEDLEGRRVEILEARNPDRKLTIRQYVESLSNADKKTLKKLLI